ncbi:MAG: DUF4390 domain-containing protein [Cardiobacteriaceae bacterium]|nr:DUF4390 domain-containing protein [Cardiobacteriaceae bacterium]
MPYLKKRLNARLKALFLRINGLWVLHAMVGVWLMIAMPQSALATIEIQSGQCDFNQHTLSLQAKLTLDEAPTEALHSGIGLSFVYHIEQIGEGFGARWWGDFQSHTYPQELYYNPIAQTYRLTGIGKDRYYHHLENALADLGTLHASYLAPNQSALPQPYEVRVSLRLDTDTLPTSLRLTTHVSPQWKQLQSAWWSCPPSPPPSI